MTTEQGSTQTERSGSMMQPNGEEDLRLRIAAELVDEMRFLRRRSAVRMWVTYMVTGTFLMSGLLIIWWSIDGGQPADFERALAVFSSIAAAAGSIIGFWFGTRGQGGTNSEDIVARLHGLGEPEGSRSSAGLHGASDGQTGAGNTTDAAKVRKIQHLLHQIAQTAPNEKLKQSMHPGGVDGVFGESTRAALDNFLSILVPPDQFKDLGEPKLDSALAKLRQYIAEQTAEGR